KTAPLEQWAVAREMRARIKARFDHEGIEMPLPQSVVWMREGQGPPPQRSGEHEQASADGPAQAE
ncbi:MAG TPA: mechanosensitive ion channel family protein, partial [Nocardioides sp.]|nr:mechanosensitive ion channel family protein [Nocardioides sp.]